VKLVGVGIVCAAILVGLFYGAFVFKRWWHYKWGYEASVNVTICELVKPEALKNPGLCK